MTICIAALFRWFYSAPEQPLDVGIAAITTSDRMITAGDIEYEPPQMKVSFLTGRILALVAGDYPTHSEAIAMVQRALAGGGPELDVSYIASLYANALMSLRSREAARCILGPLGLTLESFTSRQSEMAPSQIDDLTSQLQRFRGPGGEAMIVGSDDTRAHIFIVDGDGALSCHNDVGFAAIGLGAWHAKSVFMTNRYVNQSDHATAVGISYAAKKAAEIAPGVGVATDMHLVTRNGWLAIPPDFFREIDASYNEFNAQRIKLAAAAIQRVRVFKLAPLHASADRDPSLDQYDETPGTEINETSPIEEKP